MPQKQRRDKSAGIMFFMGIRHSIYFTISLCFLFLGAIGGGMLHTNMVVHVLNVPQVLGEAAEKIFVIKVCNHKKNVYIARYVVLLML